MREGFEEHLSGLQLTKDECKVLEFLKRKNEREQRKYEKLYKP
jgi:hypothetical protein